MAESSEPNRLPLASLPQWWRAFLPAPVGADWRERLRVVVGAALGITLAGLLSHAAAGPSAGAAWPWLVAPLGASAVLVFGVPASPLAQPWAVVGGNTLSALVGISCVAAFGSSPWTAGLAVGLAIALMFVLRCLHPPGGASALLAVMAGVADPLFAFYPVLVNSLLLTAAGIAYNHATGRAYPHMQLPAVAGGEPAARDHDAEAFDADLDAVLARYNQVLDISRDDLKALLEDTQLRGYQRQLSSLRCGDIMSRNLITVDIRTPLATARALFGEHRIKALPVVDKAGGIVGIVTPADFMRAADPALRSGPVPQAVGEIMTRKVRVASVNRHLAELIPLFGSTGHHHIPIIDGDDRLVGIITQTDVVAALANPGAPRGGSPASAFSAQVPDRMAPAPD
ncbi:HPP family protein [Piscinibacter sakaiensis]|uniref:HPP family protein n=1 Tax=Piscinibacter sakaiensis TaxID=1547922 RepID=UPI003AAB6445